jgi:hypothetical protein
MATQTKTTAAAATATAAEAVKKGQEFMTDQIGASEKIVDAAIEFNAAAFRGAEAVYKKAYENYVANVASAFEGAKALNKAADASDFYSVSMANYNKAAETMTEQYKAMTKLVNKAAKDTGDAARAAYTKAFA